MDTIQIKDKMFTVSIKEQDILKEVTRVANEINRDLAGKNPLFLSVLNGAFRPHRPYSGHCRGYRRYGTHHATLTGHPRHSRSQGDSYCLSTGETR